MKPKILIVEDDQALINLFREVFRMEGVEVVEILQTGKEGIEMVKEIREGKKERPDLILTDLILPDINGIEILKEVKKYPETKDIKVYALTNYFNPDFNKELIKEGVDKILIKVNHSLKEIVSIIKEGITKK